MTETAELVAYLKEYRFQLGELPYAGESEADGAIDILAKELERFSPLQVLRWESNLSDPYYRVLCLHLMKEFTEKGEPTVWEKSKLTEPTLVTGDLHVTGNLDNQENLVVLGDLTIDGTYTTLGEYPCCFVGGNMSAKNLFATEAETSCLGTLAVESTVVLLQNHTVTVAKHVEAKTLIADEAYIEGEVVAEVRYDHQGDGVYKTVFGIEFDEDDPDFYPWRDVHEKVIKRMRAE